MNAVLWWLCQNTVAIALMIPLVLVLARAFQTRPAVQHVLWLVLLVKLLLPPLVELPWSVESILSSGQSTSVEPEAPLAAIAPLPALEPITVAPEMIELPIATPPHPPLQPNPLLTIAAIGDAIVAFWVVGGALAFSVQLRRIARHRTLIRAGTEAPRHLHNEIGRVAKQMGLRPLHTVVVPRITSPFVWCFGWLRLIWPEALLAERDVLRSRGMIAHELAHVRRRDHWIAWLELIVGLIWWWNPLFWFVRRRLRESAEWACDALAIAALPDERRTYAELFLELSSSFKSGTPVPVLGMSTGAPSSFERRLTMILSEHVSGKMSWRGFLLAATLAAVMAPSWSLGQSSKPPASPPPLTDFEKRVLQELRERQRAITVHEAELKLKAAEADLAMALADWERSQDPLELMVLDMIATSPVDMAECEAFLSSQIYKLRPIRLRVTSGFDTFRINSRLDESKPLFVGKTLRIDDREIYFQAGKDVYKMTMHQSLAKALRVKLDATQLDALGLTKRIDAAFATTSVENLQKRPDPAVAERSKARLNVAQAQVKAAKSHVENLRRDNPDIKSVDPPVRPAKGQTKSGKSDGVTASPGTTQTNADRADQKAKGDPAAVLDPQTNTLNPFIPTPGLIIRAQTRTHTSLNRHSEEETKALEEIRTAIRRLIEQRVRDEFANKEKVELEKSKTKALSDADKARLKADQEREVKFRIEAAMSLLQDALKSKPSIDFGSNSLGKAGGADDMQQLIKLITVVVDPNHWYYVQQKNSKLAPDHGGRGSDDPKQPNVPTAVKPPQRSVKGVVERVDTKDPTLVSISIGADQGLKVQDTLEVYRVVPTAEYVGRIRVEVVHPSKSIARLVSSAGAPPRVISEGDTVSSSRINDAHFDATALLREGRASLQAGRLDEAAMLAHKAEALKSQYGLFEDSPKKLLDDIVRGRGQDANAAKIANAADNVVIRLKNASAADVAKVLDEAFNGRVPNNRIRVIADPGGANFLIVRAAPQDLATVRDVINRLDVDNNVLAQRSGGDARVLPLANVQAKEIAKVLIELFKKEVGQGLTIVAEPMTNSLLIRGTVAEQDAVAAVVRDLETAHDRARPPIPAPKAPQEKVPSKKANLKEAMIEKALSRRVSLTFQDVPLYRVVEDLRVISGLNIVVDQTALKSKNIRLEQPLRLKVEDVALDSALKLLLRQAKLTYVIRDEVLSVVPDSANPSPSAPPDARRSPEQVLEPPIGIPVKDFFLGFSS